MSYAVSILKDMVVSHNSKTVFPKTRVKAMDNLSKSLIGQLVLLEAFHVCIMSLSLLPDPREKGSSVLQQLKTEVGSRPWSS